MTQELLEERVEIFPNVNGYRFTNNDMEMTAVLLCLQAALRLGVDDLRLHSDSEWTVRIITGEYRLGMEKFKDLRDQLRALSGEFNSFTIAHVPREKNQRADWLCTKATGQKRATANPPAFILRRPQVR